MKLFNYYLVTWKGVFYKVKKKIFQNLTKSQREQLILEQDYISFEDLVITNNLPVEKIEA